MTQAHKILEYHYNLKFNGQLPDNIQLLNPFEEGGEIKNIIETFYKKYYNDFDDRVLIFGINPGRLGAGATGIPFTDTKRLSQNCGIETTQFSTHEPSSVFIYDVINAYGGAELFYKNFYINSVCPLGFVIESKGKKINYNYYDSKELTLSVEDFILNNIKAQIGIARRNDIAFCLGTGKNFKYLTKLNQEHHFFDKIIPLEHPRFIMQYKNKEKDKYIEQYLAQLNLI